MTFLGNALWILLGGWIVALCYLVPGAIFCITIIGLPFGIQLIRLAGLSLMPFGKEIYDKPAATGCVATIFNICWILLGGVWVSISHLVLGGLFAITIVGIPFAQQHLKLMAFALTPFGKDFK